MARVDALASESATGAGLGGEGLTFSAATARHSTSATVAQNAVAATNGSEDVSGRGRFRFLTQAPCSDDDNTASVFQPALRTEFHARQRHVFKPKLPLNVGHSSASLSQFGGAHATAFWHCRLDDS